MKLPMDFHHSLSLKLIDVPAVPSSKLVIKTFRKIWQNGKSMYHYHYDTGIENWNER